VTTWWEAELGVVLQPYERLKAWKVSHDLALQVYRCSNEWPPAERYGLTSQARRAAYSIGANIAEGIAK
jgi:four helix bundle protein